MTIDFALQREKMVDGQIRTTGVTSFAILEAMSSVPREEFVPEEVRAFAYIDEDLPVLKQDGRATRFLMEPSPFARLLQMADIGRNDVVLEIGCATGYSTAVISCLAGSVIAVESDASLAAAASETLARLGFATASVVQGPLEAGYPAEAPYDVILLNGAVEEVPEALFGQLRDGGRLAAIVGTGNTGTATLWTASSAGLSLRREFNASVRLLAGFERERAFIF